MFAAVIDVMFYSVLLLPIIAIVGGLLWLLIAVQLSSMHITQKPLELFIRVSDWLFGVEDNLEKPDKK